MGLGKPVRSVVQGHTGHAMVLLNPTDLQGPYEICMTIQASSTGQNRTKPMSGSCHMICPTFSHGFQNLRKLVQGGMASRAITNGFSGFWSYRALRAPKTKKKLHLDGASEHFRLQYKNRNGLHICLGPMKLPGHLRVL